MSRKRFLVSACASAVALAMAGTDAHALGLGGIRIQSALNQPFVGEIDLLDVKPDELDTVKAQLATADEFKKVGSERYHYLTKLRFSAQLSPRGNAVLRVTSREPIREPYMDFLVEALWPKGRLVRQYTVLLDPPVTTGRSAPRIAPPVYESEPSRAPASDADSVPRPPRSAPTQPPISPSPRRADEPPPRTIPVAARAGSYPMRFGPVRSGMGLWRLALKKNPPGATVAQTAMALYRNNQGAFIGGDINRVIQGRTLTIPSSAELFALDPEAAQREFEAALRGEKVRRAPIAPAAPGDDGSRLKIAGTAPLDAAQAATPDVPPAPAGGVAMEELLLVREASESARQETLELRGRIRDLESQLSEIQQLLKLRNAQLARFQGEEPGAATPADLAPAPAGSETVAAVAPGAMEGAPAAPPETPPESEASTPPAAPPLAPPSASPGAEVAASATATLEPEQPAPPGPETAASLAGAPPADTSGAGSKPLAPVEPASQVAVVTEPPRAKPPAPRVPEASARTGSPSDSTWHQLLLPLAGLAGVTALGIGGLAWWRTRRRRVLTDSNLDLDSSDLMDQNAVGATRGRSAAKGRPVLEESFPEADAPPSAFVDISHPGSDTDEADVISEADIYIAYGRYREAEELLRDEIARSPKRLELKYKLAEAYFGARNRPALDALTAEIRAAGGDRSHPELWQRLMEMIAGKDEGGAESLLLVASGPTRGSQSAGAGRLPGSSLLDSFDVGLKESFSLDLGEGLRSSVQRASQPAPVAPAESDASVAALFRDEPLLFDEDALGNGLARDSERHGMDSRALGGQTIERPSAVSDLELTIDDLRLASDLDLDSLVESVPASGLLVERHESRGPRVAGGPNLRSVGAPTVVPAAMPFTTPAATEETRVRGGETTDALGLASGQGDSPSSDLIVSQWQMDSGLWDETATKLDLARAYVEMGDLESARGILDEVLGEGNEAQRGEARALLRQMG